MTPDLRLVRSPATADPADQQFRLLVSSVVDYAIYLLDGARHQQPELLVGRVGARRAANDA
jgi:hypothetical protein